MKKYYLNLQLFADGGAAGAAGPAGANAGGTGEAETGVANPSKGRETATVLYGKQEGVQSDDNSGTETGNNVTARTLEEKNATFNDLIRGEYKDQFNDRVQQIVQKRIGDTKGMQAELDGARQLMYAIAERYGVDAKDAGKLLEAFNNDKAFYEAEAAAKGIPVETLMEIEQLKAKNKAFEEAYNTQQMQARGEETYNRWMREAETLQSKYGIADFNFQNELQNPEFANLLKNGISVEGAYKAIHFDDMLGGAMAATAKNVSQQVANNVANRHRRATEGAISSQQAVEVKKDVSKLTNADIEEINRRVASGETISF